MSCLVIDTDTFSMSNITDTIRNMSDIDAFNLLSDFISSGQIRGMHYTHAENLGEAEKAALIDGYDINYCFFMQEDDIGL